MPSVTRFACTLLIVVLLVSPAAAAAPLQHILTSTFPIYQITRNITAGQEGVQVDLLLPARLGCPHDYALTPQDMQMLGHAEVLIINGLGLEEFLGAPLRRANPNLVVIDSSEDLDEILLYRDTPETGDDHSEKQIHDHDHSGANPHLFASPRMAARQVQKIAAELARLDPAAAPLYRRNAQSYGARLESLAVDFATLGQTLKNRRIITEHGVFDYLARDIGLDVVAVIQAHPGQEPAAAEMLKLIRTAKAEKVGAIFTEPQYPARVAATIAREAGIPCVPLDPAASGEENAPLNSYETTMRNNMLILQTTLGTR